MRRLRFICIEDDIRFAEILKTVIIRYFQLTNFVVTVELYQDIPINLNLDTIDGCFLDIQIGNHDITNFIKNIKTEDFKIPIILISNYDDYIFQTVHLQIFDFIRKSRFNEEIIETLNRLQDYLEYKSQSIFIEYNGSAYHISINDILYIETLSHHTIIHCKQGMNYEIWRSYNTVFKESYTSLMRTHKSYVINMNYCYRVDKNLAYIKDTNIKIPVSQRNYKNVSKKFREINSILK